MQLLSVLAGALLLLGQQVLACSRVTYSAQVDDRITIGRSMDFVTSTNESIYIWPAGLARNGSVGPNSLIWTSKYGSMVTVMYDVFSVDGMNTQGLTASALYLGVSDYGQRNTSRPGVAIGFWLQYFLDMYSTVNETANALKGMDLQVITANLVPDVSSTTHLSLSDKSGDNLILEYVNGQLVMYHGKQYSVFTNDPTYDQLLAINAYWEPMSNLSLPGTGTPADRYVRLAYYNSLSPSSNDLVSSVATTAAMIRAVSVPFAPDSVINKGIDVWPTLWRVYQDTKDMVYFHESAVLPMSFYMNFSDYDMSTKGSIMRLGMNVSWEDRWGDMNGKFVNATTFKPLGAL